MNEYEREYAGVKLVAKYQEGCNGCYFDNPEKDNGCFGSPCAAGARRDGKEIIWIAKSTIDQPMPPIQQPADTQPPRQERIAKAFNITTGKDLSADDIKLIEFLVKKIK